MVGDRVGTVHTNYGSSPQLPFKIAQIPANRDHKALNGGTMQGGGREPPQTRMEHQAGPWTCCRRALIALMSSPCQGLDAPYGKEGLCPRPSRGYPSLLQKPASAMWGYLGPLGPGLPNWTAFRASVLQGAAGTEILP